MRNPLEKQTFLSGVRQKWTGIFLIYAILIAVFQIKFNINPEPYISFAVTIGGIFLLGGSVDSVLKINAAKEKPRKTLQKLKEEREAQEDK